VVRMRQRLWKQKKIAPIICMGWFRKGCLNKSCNINLEDVRTKEELHAKFG